MGYGRQPARRVRAERDALDGRRAVTGELEHLLPGQCHLDRAAGRAGRERGQDRVRPGRALGPESAADVRRDDPHPLRGQAEHTRDRVPVGGRALGGVVDGQVSVGVPRGQRGMRFHRVVVLHRGRVRHVHPRRRPGQAGLDITVGGHRGQARVDRVRRIQAGVVGPQPHVVLMAVDGEQYRGRGRPRVLQRVGHHGRHQLTPVADLAGGEQGQRGVLHRSQLRRVDAGQNGEHAGHGPHGTEVDGTDEPAGRRRLDRARVRRGRLPALLVGVPGPPGHLVPTFHPVHANSSSMMAAMRFRASVTL